MKKLILIAVVLLVLGTSVFCSSHSYADDVASSDISAAITKAIDDGQEYVQFADSHIKHNFGDQEFEECTLVYSAKAENISEIGVFHTKDKDSADALVELCRAYIEDMQQNSRAFIASYAPEELPSLDAAQVRRFGNYVVYTVLPEAHSDAAFDKVKEILKK